MNTNIIYDLEGFLNQVIDKKCWTAWRAEKRTNVSGKITITKVPYSKIGVKSETGLGSSLSGGLDASACKPVAVLRRRGPRRSVGRPLRGLSRPPHCLA